MDISFLESLPNNHLTIGILIVFLVLYQLATIKIKKLPKIPLRLVILYLMIKMVDSVIPDSFSPKIELFTDLTATIVFYCALIRITFFITVEQWYKIRRGAVLPKITRDLFLIVSYALIALVLLHTRGGVNLVGLITTSAVLTAVIGLAAQNVLGNLFAGISIQASHPYRLGDWIQYGDHTGKVVGLNWESTRLKTFDDEMIIIPNADIAKSVLKNHSLPTIRHAMKINVNVEYGASPDKVRKVLLNTIGEESRILQEPAPVIRVREYADFAITYQIRFFYNDFGTDPDLRAAVLDKIWYALRRNNIKIPYPVRDVRHSHIERRFEECEAQRLRNRALAEIGNVPIIKPLSAQSKQMLADNLKIEEYGPNEMIVRQGDAGDSLYIIHKGACDVDVVTGNSPPARVATLIPPSFFGEMSLLTGEPRSATVKCRTDTIVFSINRTLFKDILIGHPEVSETLANVLSIRQAETAGAIEKQSEEFKNHTRRLLGKIRSFFGI